MFPRRSKEKTRSSLFILDSAQGTLNDKQKSFHHLKVPRAFPYQDFECFAVETSELHCYSSKEFRHSELAFDALAQVPASFITIPECKLEFLLLIKNNLVSEISKKCEQHLQALMYLLNARYLEEANDVASLISEITTIVLLMVEHGFVPLLLSLFFFSVNQQNSHSPSFSKHIGLLAASISSLSCYCLLQALIVLKTVPHDEVNEHLISCVKSDLESPVKPSIKPCLLLLTHTLTLYTSKQLIDLPIRRVVILLRVVFLFVFGGLSETESKQKASRTLHHLSNDTRREQEVARSDLFTKGVIVKPRCPKIRSHQLKCLLSDMYERYFGCECTSMSLDTKFIGVPNLSWESFHQAKKHLYVSLADAQHEMWQNYAVRPLTSPPPLEPIDSGFTHFYKESLISKNFPTSLLKIMLLLLSFSRKSSVEPPINVSREVVNVESDHSNSFTYSDDLARHKEIMLKNVSFVTLLLLKHLKANHIYQYHTFLRHLYSSQCIVILSYLFKMDLLGFVYDIIDYPENDFPWGLIRTESQKSINYRTAKEKPFSRRNLFTIITVLRILQKLIKDSPAEIERFVELGGSKFVHNALELRFGLPQIYGSKLLKCVYYLYGERCLRENIFSFNIVSKCVLVPFYDNQLYMATDDEGSLERRVKHKRLHDALKNSHDQLAELYNSRLIAGASFVYDCQSNQFWFKDNLAHWKGTLFSRLERIQLS